MTALIPFALKNWRLILTGLALATASLMIVFAKADARHWRKVAAGEKAAHEQTVANYRLAAEQARLADAQNIIRVKAEQAQITERISDDYQDRIADSDARYERLRRTQATANPRGPGGEDVSAIADAACRAAAGTSCEGIPPLLREAQRNTDQLVALQAWNKGQAGVDVSGE